MKKNKKTILLILLLLFLANPLLFSRRRGRHHRGHHRHHRHHRGRGRHWGFWGLYNWTLGLSHVLTHAKLIESINHLQDWIEYQCRELDNCVESALKSGRKKACINNLRRSRDEMIDKIDALANRIDYVRGLGVYERAGYHNTLSRLRESTRRRVDSLIDSLE
jgi:hypothetical protein